MLDRYFPALGALDADLREVFLEKLRVRWTHTSTALEGNTLNEGETFGVLRYGLTVSGKPLADHNEILGHGRAMDFIYALLGAGRSLSEADLHALHALVQTSVEPDYLKPIASWKLEPNSTLAKVGGKTVVNDSYADPEHVPRLMRQWIENFEKIRRDSQISALEAHLWAHATFVRIHPYADGNGRMARLLANLPVIEKGFLPILIPADKRLEYIEALSQWQMASGRPRLEEALEGEVASLQSFRKLIQTCHEESERLIDEVFNAQKARRI